MIALLYILFFVVYLLITLWVIRVSYRFAKRRYQKGWSGGLLAAFIMYNLVFWDWIPVLVMHKYYCATDAGFWVYKTPEEWVKEHPEVIGQDWNDQRKWNRKQIFSDNGHLIRRTWISPYIYYEYESYGDFILAIWGGSQSIIDAESEKILSKAIEFSRGNAGEFGGSWTDMKFWLALGNRTCGSILKNGKNTHKSFYQDITGYSRKLRMLVNEMEYRK